jgi:hypothetical membrane protein
VAAGGACWAIGVVQYAVVQILAAAAWARPYSLTNNYISDLGEHRLRDVPCAARDGLLRVLTRPCAMNASFAVFGVPTVAGALLLRRIWPTGRLAHWALALWLLSGLGKIIVGLVLENTHIGLHLLGALNVPLGSIAILLLSLAIRRTSHTVSVIGIVVAVVGLVGSFLSTAGEFAGSWLYLGLGVGGTERLASYPGSLWMLWIGLIAMFFTGTWQSFRAGAGAR